jgi:predicted enzyme related to lactoylglutathione lyase
MLIAITLDVTDLDRQARFWSGLLDYQVAAVPPNYRVLTSASAGGGPTLVLQAVSEPRVGKNRMHLDLHPDDPVALLARAVAAGATPIGGPVTELLAQAGIWWQVLADPEGNEFCVAGEGNPPGTVDSIRATGAASHE